MAARLGGLGQGQLFTPVNGTDLKSTSEVNQKFREGRDGESWFGIEAFCVESCSVGQHLFTVTLHVWKAMV